MCADPACTITLYSVEWRQKCCSADFECKALVNELCMQSTGGVYENIVIFSEYSIIYGKTAMRGLDGQNEAKNYGFFKRQMTA